MVRRRPDGSFVHTDYPTPVKIDGLRIDLSEAELEANKRGWIPPAVNEKLLQIASQALSQALTAKGMADIETLAFFAAHKAARRAYLLRHMELRDSKRRLKPPAIATKKAKTAREQRETAARKPRAHTTRLDPVIVSEAFNKVQDRKRKHPISEERTWELVAKMVFKKTGRKYAIATLKKAYNKSLKAAPKPDK